MYRNTFTWLGLLGAVMLQGVLAINGGLLAILKSIYYGQFPSGRAMTLVYTGLPIFDQFANIQVAFWDPVVSATGLPWLQACMLCASLQTAGVWVVVESLRKGQPSRHWIIRYAPLYVFLWQGVGTAIFLPFYFMVELQQHIHPKSNQEDRHLPLSQAMAVLPAAIFTLAQPFSMVFFPPASMTGSQKQTALAIYQFGPLGMYALISTFSNLLSSSTSSRRDADAKWVKITYAVSGISSAAIHLGCLYATATNDATVLSSLNNLFVPSYSSVSSADKETFMTHASLFFLQWDFIICAIASAVYCVGILKTTVSGGIEPGSSIALIFTFLLACMVVSPGFTVSAMLLFREPIIRNASTKPSEARELLDVKDEKRDGYNSKSLHEEKKGESSS